MDGATQPADTPGRSRALLPVYLAHAMVHLFMVLFPAFLFILKRHCGQSHATPGAVYAAATLLYGVGALPVGFAVKRV